MDEKEAAKILLKAIADKDTLSEEELLKRLDNIYQESTDINMKAYAAGMKKLVTMLASPENKKANIIKNMERTNAKSDN